MNDTSRGTSAFTASMQVEALSEGQRKVIELMARGTPLPDVLETLCHLVEAHLPGVICSVLLLDQAQGRILDGAGPSLPEAYRRAINGQPIGPKAGSCGTAMHRREAVTVEDIAADPLWEDYKALVLPLGLAACASTPIFDDAGRLLGSFAIYHREAGAFRPEELDLLRSMNHLAGLAIIHQRHLEMLQDQVEKLSAAQRMAHIGFWTWLVEANRVEWSEGLFEIYGLDPLAFRASFEGYLSCVHPEDRDRVTKTIQGALAKGGVFSFEERIVRPDGEMRWLSSWGTVVQRADGQVDRLMGACLDITDLKAREREIKKFQALIENSPDFVAMASLDGQAIYVNPAGLKLVGLDRLEAAQALKIDDFLTPEAARHSAEVKMPVVNKTGHWQGESTLRPFDGGDPIPVLVSSFLVRDPSTGDPFCLATIQRDLRDQKRTEAELLQAKKLESLAVLAGGIAHDFNNLLTAVLGNLELVRASTPAGSTAMPYLDRMSQAIGRASDLARQMLAYSGKGRIVVKPLDLNPLIVELAQLIDAGLPKKASVVLDLSPDLPAIEADATQIQQVVMNLAINAVDSLKDGEGRVTIRTRQQSLDHLNPAIVFPGGTSQARAFVQLDVEDTGAGMTPEVRNRIFDPFFTTKPSGRGLGLSAMLGIIRSHHGGIQVQSEPGRGTRFTLLFPAAERKAAGVGSEKRRDFAPGGLALVVDDEPGVREAAAGMLETLGFECVLASDGVEALRLVETYGGKLRLVLLDLSMPKMDGREAFQAIHRSHPGLKVVLSSGFDVEESATEFVGRGLAGFLQKPYRIDQLRRAVETALAPSP